MKHETLKNIFVTSNIEYTNDIVYLCSRKVFDLQF